MIAQVSGSQSTAARTSAFRSGANGCRRRNRPANGTYSSFTIPAPFSKLQRSLDSNLDEIGLDQCAQFGRNLGTLAEPQLKAAHRLVQQHAEPVGRPQAPRLRHLKQCSFQRYIDAVSYTHLTLPTIYSV